MNDSSKQTTAVCLTMVEYALVCVNLQQSCRSATVLSQSFSKRSPQQTISDTDLRLIIFSMGASKVVCLQ